MCGEAQNALKRGFGRGICGCRGVAGNGENAEEKGTAGARRCADFGFGIGKRVGERGFKVRGSGEDGSAFGTGVCAIEQGELGVRIKWCEKFLKKNFKKY